MIASAAATPGRPHALWILLILLTTWWVVFDTHVTWLFNDHDDKSVLRAHAWVNAHPEDGMLERLNRHLDEHAEALGQKVYLDYRFRLNVQNVYMLPDWLVLKLERLPLVSAYQSVFLANLIIHLVAVLVLGLVLARVFGGHGLVLLLLMVVGTVVLYPFRLEKSISHHSWFTAYPRGAALTWFFAALVLGVSGWRRGLSGLGVGVGVFICLLMAYLGHSAHFAVLTSATVAALVITLLIRPLAPAALARAHGIGKFLLLFNGFIFVIIVLEMFLFQGILEIRVIPELGPRPWNRLFFHLADLMVVNLTMMAWLKLHLGEERSVFWPVGAEIFFNIFVVLAILMFALKFGIVTRQLQSSALAFAFFEGGQRVSGLVNLLVLLLLVMVGVHHFRWLRPFERFPGLVQVGMVVILPLLSMGEGLFVVDSWASMKNGEILALEPFKGERLEVRISELLQRPGVETYDHMPRYFQAIANEMRERHVK